MRGEPWSGAPPPGCAEGGPAPRPWFTAARQGVRVATGRETAFPAPVGSERIGHPTQVLGKETGPVAERKQLIEDCLGTVVISRHQSHNGAEAGATDSGWRLSEPPKCSGVTHRVGPTLPHSLLTAKVINAVAGRLLCSVQCPGHPENLACKAHSRSHRRDRPKRSGSLRRWPTVAVPTTRPTPSDLTERLRRSNPRHHELRRTRIKSRGAYALEPGIFVQVSLRNNLIVRSIDARASCFRIILYPKILACLR